MNNTITIQLNASALEKLIELQGGDEFVLTLRRATIENVLRGRSKALLNNAMDRAIQDQITKEISNQIGQIKQERFSSRLIVELKGEFKEAVNSLVRDAVAAEMVGLKKDLAERTVAEIARVIDLYKPEMDKFIDRRVQAGLGDYVNAEVKRRMEIALKG